jgi:CubicO group peptidase (beta-lactamase class C family)
MLILSPGSLPFVIKKIKMKKILLIFAVVIMHHAFASAQEGLTSPYLDSVIMAKMETGHVAGVSACIIKNGLVRWIGNYGFANIELGVPVDTTTLFYMASVSKTVTGTALMQLWEVGMFDLDDDINAYLPFEVHNPNYLTIPITFRMLCTHTSCIKDNEAVNPFYWGEDSPIPLGQFLYDYLNPAGVNYFPDLNFYNQQPGTAYNYSNVATALAGYLVEVIGDSTFAYQTKERIFNPLQMNESAWFLSEVDTSNLAMPYYWDGSALVPYGFYALSTYPAGALRTSVNQLATFLLSYMKGGTYPGGQILQSSTVDTIMSSQIPLIDPNQGLFWHKSYVGGRGLWGHDGINLGSRTSMRFYPEENTGVIVLINTAYSDCNQIVDLLFDYASDSISCSCLPEGITFSTQAQIDNFQTNYPGCTEIEGDVTINGTDITNLNGLNVLTSIGGYLDIIDNNALISLSGLDSIEAASITNLTITNNSSLSDCVAQSICDYLAVPNCTVEIHDNANGCNSPEEVITACEGQGIGDKSAEDTRNWNVSIFPNPGSGIITVEFEMQEVAYVTVAIFNLTGQQVVDPLNELKSPGQQQVQFDVSGLPPGVYYCRLQAGDRNTTTKIMISE